MNKKYKLRQILSLLIILFSALLIMGWGWVGHNIISYNTILSALPEMPFFEYWADSLTIHSVDADLRRQSDPDEAPRHYIDIDNYPEFVANGMISQDFDSLVALHGYSFVIQQGILPWAILQRFDSLQITFESGDWHSAMLHASDLGHYVADSHMPLHITRNYNGQYTGQNGIHSRFESNMINQYSDEIVYEGDSLIYIDDVSDYVFNMIYYNYTYVDSVLRADNIATAFAGNTNSSAYYEKMWELSKGFVLHLFKNASYKLTCLIYTAWINAGSPTNVDIDDDGNLASDFKLFQNYPNPFNPTTQIKFTISDLRFTALKVYDELGNEIVTLIDEEKPAGSYEVEFNAAGLPSGVYFYQLMAGDNISTKKMLLLK